MSTIFSYNACTKSSNVVQCGEYFFIAKTKAGRVPAFVLTKTLKVGREPQGRALF